MRSLVVLCVVITAVCTAPHYEGSLEERVLTKRSIEHVAYTVPAAVSHQSRVDFRSSPAVVSPIISAPVVADAVIAEPLVQARAVVAPVVYTGASAVSHQSRVDVRSSPAVVAAAPIVAEPLVDAHSVYAAPAVTVYGGSAVSHQSRVDVQSSPAIVSEHVIAPAVYASLW